MSRQIDVSAAEFATVRAVLGLSQGAFAKRLGIARRTVIRGEQRGIELPSRYGSIAGTDRQGLRETWAAACKEAEANPTRYAEAADSDAVRAILETMAKADQFERLGYNPHSVERFREHVEKVTRDIKSRARMSQAAGAPAAKSKRKKKLARRMKK